MTEAGVDRLITFEESYYPKRRPSRCYTGKGRQGLKESLLEAYKGIDDFVIINTFIKMARGGHSFPSVAEIIEAAGWADKVEIDKPAKKISGADIERIPLWKQMKYADIQDDRQVKADEWYMQKYGRA